MWHFRPRRHRHVGGWPFRIVLFQRRRTPNVAPAITTVTTATGETVNVAQPMTATVTQGAGPVAQPTVAPQQPGYPSQPPYPGEPMPQAMGSYPPVPGYPPQAIYPSQPGYPPQAAQPGYPPQVGYPSQPPANDQSDQYPPIEMKQPVANNGESVQPMALDPSGQPAQADPTQQENEEFDECACYCCCIL